jgi:hypothetical protein
VFGGQGYSIGHKHRRAERLVGIERRIPILEGHIARVLAIEHRAILDRGLRDAYLVEDGLVG